MPLRLDVIVKKIIKQMLSRKFQVQNFLREMFILKKTCGEMHLSQSHITQFLFLCLAR